MSATQNYDKAAAEHVAASMVANGELLAPNGQKISDNDFNMLLKIIEEACKGPGKIQAMVRTLGANPYLLAQAMKIANAGCPKVIEQAGIKVGNY